MTKSWLIAASLIIAILSAAFTGLSYRGEAAERELRLRPYVYSGNYDTYIQEGKLYINYSLENCGLLPAESLAITDYILLDGTRFNPTPDDTDELVCLMPGQTYWVYRSVDTPGTLKALQGAKLLLDLTIAYKSGKHAYAYTCRYKYEQENRRWTAIRGKCE